MFTVISIHTREGVIERRDTDEFPSMVEAFSHWGKKCATSNGAILVDEQGNVWAEYTPHGPSRPTTYQGQRYWLKKDA